MCFLEDISENDYIDWETAVYEYIYTELNEQINVVSRKDIENLYERHVLHSLGIAKVINFKKNTSITSSKVNT